MGSSVLASGHKKYLIFLNVSFVLVVACFFVKIGFHSAEPVVLVSVIRSERSCEGLQSLEGYKAKCFYLKSHSPCVSQGYIDYLYLFYCVFGRWPLLCCCLLFLWLLVLFYVLGNTASEYFCSSLERLSRLLNLSPTIAGVTLLSLGNGASDVFASLVSFMGVGTSNVGLSTVLGGASFISCVVVGVISISLHSRQVAVDKSDFVRDVIFFFLSLVFLIVILIVGRINLWGAIGYSSIYAVYVLVVYVSHFCWHRIRGYTQIGICSSKSDCDEILVGLPFISEIDEKEERLVFADDGGGRSNGDCMKKSCFLSSGGGLSESCGIVSTMLIMPLYLPRRLTIPVVSEERWSKPFAVASAFLAPLLLLCLWSPQRQHMPINITLLLYGVGLLLGILFGVLAFLATDYYDPPKRYLFPWLAGGFLMSVTWSYMTAQELVGLLVSFGYIYGISPSILGLTVLAWGNSLGDLITNVTMAVNGGPEGAQVAISGCYAGPIFNILVGLGFSLVGSSWYKYPSYVVIPTDPYLLETLGFLIAGLAWALLVLPRRGMRLDGFLGGGLLVLYLASISLRVIQTIGSIQLPLSLT